MIGELVAILANVVFVGSNAMFRKVEHNISAIFINMFRTGVGMITFFIIALVLGILNYIFLLPWTLWLILIISFIFGQVIGDTSYFMAQKELGTTKALAVSMTFPFFTFILDLIFLERPFDLFLIPSAIFITLGIWIITKYKVPFEFEPKKNKQKDTNIEENEVKPTKNVKAVLFGIIASLGWAAGLVMIDYGTNSIDALLATQNLSSIVGNVIRFPFAFIFLLLLVKIDRNSENNINQKHIWYWLVSASLIGTSLGVYLFTEAARIAGASIMSLVASANPLFSLPISYALNKEKISLKGFIGVFLTILGVIFILI